MKFPLPDKRAENRAPGAAVLFVEDDDVYRYAMTRRMRDKGLAVTDVPDFRGALKALESDAPIDLLLCDIKMPQDTPHGFSIARMARVRRPDLRVLFVTAFDQEVEDAVGDSKVLLKSIGDDVIITEVEVALGRL